MREFFAYHSIEHSFLDTALTSKTPNDSAKKSPFGGIDLNAMNLNLRIKRDGQGVPLPIGQQDFAQMNAITGFVPIITAITPAVDFPILSELQS